MNNKGDIGKQINIDKAERVHINSDSKGWGVVFGMFILGMIVLIWLFQNEQVTNQQGGKEKTNTVLADREEVKEVEIPEYKPLPNPTFERTIDEKMAPSVKSEPKETKSSTNLKLEQVSKKTNLIKPILSNYIDITQSTKIAFLPSNNLEMTNLANEIKHQLVDYSEALFKPKFLSTFGNTIAGLNLAQLNTFNFKQHFNCICQIKEQIKYEENSLEGGTFITAKGVLKIDLLNIKLGQTKVITERMNGAGSSKSAALESLEERFISSIKLKTTDKNYCK